MSCEKIDLKTGASYSPIDSCEILKKLEQGYKCRRPSWRSREYIRMTPEKIIVDENEKCVWDTRYLNDCVSLMQGDWEIINQEEQNKSETKEKELNLLEMIKDLYYSKKAPYGEEYYYIEDNQVKQGIFISQGDLTVFRERQTFGNQSDAIYFENTIQYLYDMYLFKLKYDSTGDSKYYIFLDSTAGFIANFSQTKDELRIGFSTEEIANKCAELLNYKYFSEIGAY